MFAQIADGSVSRWESGTPGAFAGVPARGELRSGYGNSSARKGAASGAASPGFLWTWCVFLHFFTHFMNEACLPSTSGPAQCTAPSRSAQSGSTSSTPRLPVCPPGCTGDELAGGRSQETDSKSLLPPGVSHPLEASGGPSEVSSAAFWQPSSSVRAHIACPLPQQTLAALAPSPMCITKPCTMSPVREALHGGFLVPCRAHTVTYLQPLLQQPHGTRAVPSRPVCQPHTATQPHTFP